MLRTKTATANSFLYLELGILPITYEIHKRQLSFLHHIIHLEDNDPVKKVWRNQQALPEYPNWWSDVKKLMEIYSLKFTESDIQGMSKETFKSKVKSAICKKAFEDLCSQTKEKSRTKQLKYSKFATQEYIKNLYPNQSRIVFQCRSKTLNIKEHTDYQHQDNFCRWCGVCDETLDHVVNCGINGDKIANVQEILTLGTDTMTLGQIADRIEDFLSRIET